MLIHALQIIRQELNNYLDSFGETDDDQVQLGNISQIEIPEQGELNSLKNRIVISLINVREEKTLKNSPFVRRNDVTLKAEYFNPPVFLNLYLLVSSSQNNYVNSLIFLSRISTFFQAKNVFTHQNTAPRADETLVPPTEKMEEFKLIIDMFSPSFEELNHIWGTLGGKQLPALLYVARLVEVKAAKVDSYGGLVQEIAMNVRNKINRY